MAGTNTSRVDDPIAALGRDVESADLDAWPFVDRRRIAGPPPGHGRERRAIARLRSQGATAPLLAVRWGAVAVGVSLASPDIVAGDLAPLLGAVLLSAFATVSTVRPLGPDASDTAVAVRVVAELALGLAVTVATGAWASPYVFSLVTAVLVAGVTAGVAMGIRTSVVAACSVMVVELVARGVDQPTAVREAVQWLAMMVLVALVAGHARRISVESANQHSLALDRLGRLAEANALLFSLHRLAQSLPASLDLEEVLGSTTNRIKDLLHHDAATVLLLDETDHRWRSARRHGHQGPDSYATATLPPPLKRAMLGERVVSEASLQDMGPGVAPDAASGMYAPLRARGSLIGLVAVEANRPGAFGPREADLLDGLMAPLALAIDNARWFARLRTLGAEEERTRIARDLHDRIGQSLTFLAFELDRAVRNADDGVRPTLEQLRSDLRSVIREVRDTLYDLRTDVSEDRTVGAVLGSHLERVRDRSGLVVTVRLDEQGRLPLPQERELWRIASEAIANVEKHARATRLDVAWRCVDGVAELVVADDGVGFAGPPPSRPDSYGILGMRERAASIGAAIAVDSAPGRGTTVRVTLDALPG